MHYSSSHHHALSPRNNLPNTRSHSADAYLQQKHSAADMPSRPQQRPLSQGFNLSPPRVDEYVAHQQHQHQHQQHQQQLFYQRSRTSDQQPLDYYYSNLQSNNPTQEPFDDPDALLNWSSIPRSSYSDTNSPEISRPFTPVYDAFPTTHNSPYIQSPSSSFPNQSPISVSTTVEKLNSTFPIPLPPNSYYTIPGTTTNPQSSPFSFSFLPDSPFSSSSLPLAPSPKDNNNVVMPSAAFNIDPSWQFNDISSASIPQQPTGIQSDQVWSEPHHIPLSSTQVDHSTVKVEQSSPDRHSLPLAMSPTMLMLTPGLADSGPGNEPVIKDEHTMSPHFETPSPQYEDSYDNYTSESDTPNPVNFIPPPFPSVSQSTLSSSVSVPSRNGAGRRPQAPRNTASSGRVDWNIQKKSRGRHVPTIKSVYGTLENALEVVDAMAAAGVKNDRPYLCACGLCFQRNEHLKRHQNSIHSNFKPFACPAKDCNKSFSRRDNLFQHLHVHRKEDIPHGYQHPNARKRSPP